MIKAVIVDDEPLAVELIEEHIKKIPNITSVFSTHNPLDALKFLSENKVDLLFLDVQMPVITGLDLARTLKGGPSIIFTTAYREYAVESYELNVLDYLVKPITFPRFLTAVNKFYETSSNRKVISVNNDGVSEDSSILINENKKFHRVYYNEISYLESLKEYIRVVKSDGQLVTKSTMDSMEKELPDQFLRVHRSFIINVNKVEAFTSSSIEIGEKEIPIGGSYKKWVQDRLISGK